LKFLIAGYKLAKGQISFVSIDGFPQALIAALLLASSSRSRALPKWADGSWAKLVVSVLKERRAWA